MLLFRLKVLPDNPFQKCKIGKVQVVITIKDIHWNDANKNMLVNLSLRLRVIINIHGLINLEHLGLKCLYQKEEGQESRETQVVQLPLDRLDHSDRNIEWNARDNNGWTA